MKLLTTLLLILAGVATNAWAANGVAITVISSKNGSPYDETREALKDTLSSRLGTVQFNEVVLDDSGKLPAAEVEAIKQAKTDLLCTLGSSATRQAWDKFADHPAILALAFSNKDFDESAVTTGVSLEYTIKTQLTWLKRFLPKAKKIGIIYNPEKQGEWLGEESLAASRLGLELVTAEAEGPKQVPAALKKLARHADVLLATADKTIYSRQISKAVLLWSFRNRIPFVGLSKAWVKAGALYALDRDYQSIGKQIAQMAVQVKQGTAINKIPASEPQEVVYSFNLKTAKHMKIKLEPWMTQEAKDVYE